MTALMLRVKQIRLKMHAEEPLRLHLEVQGEGPVLAGDIECPSQVEIVNPELYLCAVDDPQANMYVEFIAAPGRGYSPAEERDKLSIGELPVDAIFGPVRKVSYHVGRARVGQMTNFDRLTLEVWTDGTTSPVDAVSRGAGILIEQLTPFLEYAKISQMKAEERLIRLSIPDEKYNMSVDQLDLSVRTMNCLRRSGIATVGELIAKGPKDLMKLRNFGQKSAQEIEGRINSLGLSLYPQETTDEEEKETLASPC